MKLLVFLFWFTWLMPSDILALPLDDELAPPVGIVVQRPQRIAISSDVPLTTIRPPLFISKVVIATMSSLQESYTPTLISTMASKTMMRDTSAATLVTPKPEISISFVSVTPTRTSYVTSSNLPEASTLPNSSVSISSSLPTPFPSSLSLTSVSTLVSPSPLSSSAVKMANESATTSLYMALVTKTLTMSQGTETAPQPTTTSDSALRLSFIDVF